jgi:hypothetical protein
MPISFNRRSLGQSVTFLSVLHVQPKNESFERTANWPLESVLLDFHEAGIDNVLFCFVNSSQTLAECIPSGERNFTPSVESASWQDGTVVRFGNNAHLCLLEPSARFEMPVTKTAI